MDIFKKRLSRTLLIAVVLILVFGKSAKAQQTISLSFAFGYIGTQGSNSNQAKSIKKFSTLGISKVSFNQIDANGDGKFGDGGTQGNDLAGVIKLHLNSGTVISLNGALNWRETTGSKLEVFGIIFDAGQNASIPYSGGTYSIVGGSTSNTSSNLGLKAYASNFVFTDDENRSGNAANNMLDELNAELINSPQPSTIALTNASVTEGQNLVYTVTLTSATTANNPQVYTFSSAGTASSSVDYNSTYTFSNGVVNNGDGTITVPGGVSSFTITVATIDDASVESTETLILNIGSKSATGSILDNDAVPAITTSGTLKTFTSCSSIPVSAQSFTVSGVYLTNNIVLTAPTGFQVSTTSNSGFASSITLTPSTGTLSTTTVYAKLTDNSTAASSGIISVTSTGATSKTITVTTNTDNALDFDGLNDKVTLPTSVVNGLTNFTFEAWVNPSSYSSLQRLLDCGRDGNYYMLFAVDNGKPFFAISSNGYPTIQTTATIPLNTWSHLAVVLNDATDVVTIYINGQVAASSNTMTKNPSNIGTISSADMGNSSIYPGQLFKGKMDEVRIWNTARTASEIANNYLNELVGNESGLQAYYNMNQGVANGANSGLTTLNDRSASARNGTLTNFALSGTSSNYVSGIIPDITAAGNATTLLVGNTVQLSNSLTGGGLDFFKYKFGHCKFYRIDYRCCGRNCVYFVYDL